MRKLFIAAFAASLLIVSAGTARAQDVDFGLGGGVSFPNGNLSDALGTGFNLEALLNISAPLLPFGIRVDGGYQRLPFQDSDVDYEQWQGTANARFIMNTPGLAPYLLFGGGLYGTRVSAPSPIGSGTFSSDWQTDFGLNGGVGLRLPVGPLNGFVEARLHHVFMQGDDGETIPVTFGVVF